MAGKKQRLVFPNVDVSGHAVDCELIPDPIKEELSRIIFRGVREFFSNPAVKADYCAMIHSKSSISCGLSQYVSVDGL